MYIALVVDAIHWVDPDSWSRAGQAFRYTSPAGSGKVIEVGSADASDNIWTTSTEAVAF